MAKSEAYARIKADVFTIVRAIPRGQVTSFALIGEFLDVVPRQVAFLLALRNDAEREESPWHRVVGTDGSLGTPKFNAYGKGQAELLRAEGVTINAKGQVAGFDARCFVPTTTTTGVTPTPRAQVVRGRASRDV